MSNVLYYYETEDSAIHEHQVSISEIFMVSILSKIARGRVEPSVHHLEENIKIFYFPSGRIWHANGNRFVAQNITKYRQVMMAFRRQRNILESKKRVN